MNRKHQNLLLIGLILIGLFLRSWLAVTLRPWIDEVFTLEHIQLSPLQMLHGNVDPTHPFGYYLLIKLWSLLSHKLLWLRMSSLVLYISNCLLLWKIFQKTKQEVFHYFILFFYVFSGYSIIFDWQLRMYSGVVTLVLASWYALLKKKYGLFAFINIVGLYFDYAYLWYLFPLTILLGHSYWLKKKTDKPVVKATILSWLAFIPWLPTFISNFSQGVNGVSWNANLIYPAFFVPYFLGTHTNQVLTIVLLILCLGGGYIVCKKQKNISARFFISAGVISGLASLIAASIVGPIFHVRNLQIIGLATLFSFASASEWLWKKNQKILVATILFAFVVNVLFVLHMHYANPESLLLRFK